MTSPLKGLYSDLDLPRPMTNTVENPVEWGDLEIRKTVSPFINHQVKGVFPKNSAYMRGDYNRVYCIEEGFGEQGHGFFQKAKMVTLEPDGEFKSGMVSQYVGDWNSRWEFYHARLDAASPLSVVRYAPTLLLKMYEEIEKELPRQKEPLRIQQALEVLSTRPDVLRSVVSISHDSLLEMGEDDPAAFPHGDQDYGEIALPAMDEMIKEMTGQVPANDPLEKYRLAFNLLTRRPVLEEELGAMAASMRVRPIEGVFKEVVAEVVGKGLFLTTHKDDEKLRWFGTPVAGGYNIVRRSENLLLSTGTHNIWSWGISEKGDIREIQQGDGCVNFQRCPEHLLQMAPRIMNNFIQRIVGEQFPDIERY